MPTCLVCNAASHTHALFQVRPICKMSSSSPDNHATDPNSLASASGAFDERERERLQQIIDDFARNSKLVTGGKVGVPSVADRLRLYALYSVAVKGAPPKRAPSQWLDPTAYAKWTAWTAASDLGAHDAMLEYNQRVRQYLTQDGSASDRDNSPQDDGTFSFGSKAISGFTLGSNSTDNACDAQDDNGEDDISTCAADGNVNGVLALLSRDKSLVNWRDEEGLTPLIRAADRDALDVVKILLDNGADVMMSDSDGLTALHYAALCGHARSAALLVQYGGCPFTKDLQGQSAISIADASTKLAICQAQNVNNRTRSFTPSALASKPTVTVCALVALATTAVLAWSIRKRMMFRYPPGS